VSSQAVTLADAVVAELNNGSFSQSFTAVRRLLPDYDLEDLATLRVTVLPRQLSLERLNRAFIKAAYVIDVGIQKKIGADVDGELPGLIHLVEEITDYLAGRSLAGMTNAQWITNENDPLYDRDHLAGQRVFTSVISATYWITR